MIIRKAMDRDLDEIIDLYNVLGARNKYKALRNIPFVKKIVRQFDRLAYEKLLKDIHVLHDGDSIRGLINLNITNECVFIRSLVVVPQNKKHGQFLLNYAKFQAIKNQIPLLELLCHTSNARALKFYRKNKFKVTDLFFPDGTVLLRYQVRRK